MILMKRLNVSGSICEISSDSGEIEGIKQLPHLHNDPFDRLLISQAKLRELAIITRDTIIPKYDVKTVW